MGYKFNPFTGNFDDVGIDTTNLGDFVGPASSTDNAIVRFDGTTGKLGQNSGVIIDDNVNLSTTETLTTVTVPAFTGASGVNWTFGAGWTTPLAGALVKSADGTGTMTPTGTFTITAGVTYKVVIVVSAISAGLCEYTIGGRKGRWLQAVQTYTDYITAGTTAKLILSPSNTSRFTIDSITVQAITTGTSGLSVYGESTFYSPINIKNNKIMLNGGTAMGQSNNGAQTNVANWFFGGAGGTLAHTGEFIVGIGSSAVQNAAAGSANLGVGFNTLSNGSLTGNDNLSFGVNAGRDTTTGNNNCYFGSSAGIQITTGSRNTGFGREALQGNKLGAYNTASGYQSMFTFAGDGASDDKNSALGAFSGYSLTTGKNNTIVGAGTNTTGTTGSPGITTGTGNTVLGANVTNLGNPTNNIVIAIGTGAIKLQYDATNWLVTGAAFAPSTNDAVALGTTSLKWSDLHLADGGVINWNNGNATLTHSSALLTSNVKVAVPKLKGTTAAPSIAGGAGAGTTPTVSITGSDLAGEITVTTDIDPTTSAVFATITFTSAFASAPYVVIYPSNDAAIFDLTRNSAGMYINSTTTDFTINTNSNTSPTASTELKFMYHVIE